MKHISSCLVALWLVSVAGCSSDSADSGSKGQTGTGTGGTAGEGNDAGQDATGGTRPDCAPNVSGGCVAEMCRPEANNCGHPSSILDSNGCYRAKCSAPSECAAGEECREVTYSPITCGYGLPPDDQVCSCGTNLSLITESMCFPK